MIARSSRSLRLAGLGLSAVAHGRFWLARERDDAAPPRPAALARVVAVVPARDEADVIAALDRQPAGAGLSGPFRVVLVDDSSSDGTAESRARRATARPERLRSLARRARCRAGWTGKLWAVAQGVARGGARPSAISGSPTPISRTSRTTCAELVARAEQRRTRADLADGEAALQEPGPSGR